MSRHCENKLLAAFPLPLHFRGKCICVYCFYYQSPRSCTSYLASRDIIPHEKHKMLLLLDRNRVHLSLILARQHNAYMLLSWEFLRKGGRQI